MMKSAIVACAVAGAAAFAPSPKVRDVRVSFCPRFLRSADLVSFKIALFRQAVSKSQLALGLDDIGGSSLPVPNFDPLNLATSGSDETLLWYRAAELKHSRVAMVRTLFLRKLVFLLVNKGH